ncbi:uncharacterized protein LOC117585479 isoform X1 [Drosophila guanche]|uniref:uncharacterized protein LOC117585479 isoform X1 n=1 Tax=Drosophila guanche TaxID=7266 RepID=UPI001471CD48|nr:uncharacterized protein LOC117585479 isoform X1 [Drosophila guanche]
MASQLFLVALLGIALVSATPVPQQAGSANFTSAMARYLQAFRSIMPCGYAPEGIPALAPIFTPFYAYDISTEDFSLKGNVTNMRIEGLNNFQILSAKDYGKTGEAAYDVIFPKIQILGATEVEGFINIGGFHLPIRQQDVINEALVDLRFVGSYTFANSLTKSSGLRIVDFKQSIYLADVLLNNWNSLWNISTNNFWNRYGSIFISLGLEEIQPKITDLLYQNYFVPKINELLANVSMEELVNYFQSQTQLWESAHCQA